MAHTIGRNGWGGGRKGRLATVDGFRIKADPVRRLSQEPHWFIVKTLREHEQFAPLPFEVEYYLMRDKRRNKDYKGIAYTPEQRLELYRLHLLGYSADKIAEVTGLARRSVAGNADYMHRRIVMDLV